MPAMRDLLEHPLWRPEDLGAPIPDSPHAVSVCLPTWRDNVGYEEGEARVTERLATGYPRFVYNRFCRDLFRECERRFAREDETCLVYPTRPAAERLAAFLERQTGDPARIEPFGVHDVHAVCFPRRHAAVAKAGWQHAGEGISSRQAEACLTGRPLRGSDKRGTGTLAFPEFEADNDDCREPVPVLSEPLNDGTEAKRTLRERVARMAEVHADDVFLFPCGMSAFFALHRALMWLFDGRKSVQFGFPYVDALKVQEKFGAGVHFFPQGNAEELDRLADLVRHEPLAGISTEFPSNPLLVSPDLEKLAGLARRHGVPLVVDDTLAACINADLLEAADVVCTSLTKFFSGAGDVTGGSLVLNRRSPFYSELASGLRRHADDLLWGEDAIVLERNSRDFAERVRTINRNAELLADFLSTHPRVARVYYPKYQTPGEYLAFQRADGGYGGLLSLELHDAPTAAPRFFDALPVCKGPNLGTNYTLACPYTILAHYGELDFAESCGVSRFLVRVSVGLEDPDELCRRFEQALTA